MPPLELFHQRARAVDPAFVVDDGDAAMEICRRLDGMPLAIELAAARVRSMTLPELSSFLADRFRLLRGGAGGGVEHHRTLHAAMSWSYDLLDARARDVFERMSVFAGGFSLDAVVAVCPDQVVDEVDAVEIVDDLVARSLLVASRSADTTRYSLLETLRQFGEENLLRRGETANCRARHAAHFASKAKETRRVFSTSDCSVAVGVFGESGPTCEWHSNGRRRPVMPTPPFRSWYRCSGSR